MIYDEHSQSYDDSVTMDGTINAFAEWLSRPYISGTLREQLKQTNVLFVPTEGFRGHPGPVFPVGTQELLTYIRDRENDEIIADVCIEESDFRELALHSALIMIGTLVVTQIVLPIVKDIIGDYLKKRSSNTSSARVSVKIIAVDETGSSKAIDFEGLASDFQSSVKPIVQYMFLQSQDSLSSQTTYDVTANSVLELTGQSVIPNSDNIQIAQISKKEVSFDEFE